MRSMAAPTPSFRIRRSGASLTVTALDNDSINATINATATASGGSAGSGGLGRLSLITFGHDPGDQRLDLDQRDPRRRRRAFVDSRCRPRPATSTSPRPIPPTSCQTMSAVSVTVPAAGVAVGVIMADNTIGAAFQNLLDSTVDTIAGGNVLGPRRRP